MIGYGAWLAAETAAVQRSEQWSPALSRLAATMQTSIQKDMSQTAPGMQGLCGISAGIRNLSLGQWQRAGLSGSAAFQGRE